MILADLDLEALGRFRAERGSDFNLALVERYFPEVYEEYRPREQGGRRPMNPTEDPLPA